MRFADVHDSEDIHALMTEPTDALVAASRSIDGPVMILGGSGKMGPELVGMLARADQRAGVERRVMVASTFSDPKSDARERLARAGAETFRGDLSDRAFLATLPDAPHVVYMAGFKFGSEHDRRRAFHMNAIMPYLVAERYAGSAVVVFSSGNPYPHSAPERGGVDEDTALAPQGIYGWCVVARESAFETVALRSREMRLCTYRLMYAQHLAYGVLVDLASLVRNNAPISLAVPAVNLISQRDANDVALRALAACENPALVLNVAGPVVGVRDICRRMGEVMGTAVRFADGEADEALLAGDRRCASRFGPYRDTPEEMIDAAARWVMRGGQTWHKPTLFGRADHRY